jgi:hypothetical protein
MWTIIRHKPNKDQQIGPLVVEIINCGAGDVVIDTFPQEYGGELVEFNDPRVVAKEAWRIALTWQRTVNKEVLISCDGTSGIATPLADVTRIRIEQWANDLYNCYGKCLNCGEIIPSGTGLTISELDSNEEFCDELCRNAAIFGICLENKINSIEEVME